MSDELIARPGRWITVTGDEGSQFAGVWVEIRANRNRAVSQALIEAKYWRDLAPILAPLIRDWGGITIDALEHDDVPAVLADDGETELLPARTVPRLVRRELPFSPAADGGVQSVLDLADGDPELADWLQLQAITAPRRVVDDQKKQPGPNAGPTPDGTQEGEMTPITTITAQKARRARAS